MSNAPDHALSVLDFSGVLDVVAGFAGTELGAARVRALEPSFVHAEGGAGIRELTAEHARVAAMRALLTRDGGWESPPIPDIGASLTRLRIEGSSWTAAELRNACVLLTSSRVATDALAAARKDDVDIGALDALSAALVREPALEKDLDRIVDDEGLVRDGASPALKRLRKDLRGAEGELVKLLEKLMARMDAHHRVDDASVTMRNGRWVIPVRREGRASVGGIVHDSSATGATVFVEPPVAVEHANRIREMEMEEHREVERILREATDALRPRREALEAALEALVALDSLVARGRYAERNGCAPAALAPGGSGFAIHNGRHPLLLAQGATVVPFDLVMEGGERTLLVSGPNTGGKTVLLKAVALISLMAQAGIPAPVGAGSTIGVFDRVFADIGDEQSIAASLSTFSAHLKNLVEILVAATPDSLVLMDELGSGTDPTEGAALGGAILADLTRRGTLTLATTHLGALKELAQEVPGVVNASLQFDSVALAPTYRLIKGVPGRSYGLSIARRLGFPETTMRNAEERIPAGERDVGALLEDMQKREQVLAAREQDAAERLDAVTARSARLAEREQTVREKERELEKNARADARRYVLDARKEIEKTIAGLKAAGAAEIEAAAASARREAERIAGEQAAELERLESGDERRVRRELATSDDHSEAGDVGVGDAVAVATLGGKAGKVLETRDGDVVVVVGTVKLTVPRTAVRRVSRRALEPAVSVPVAVGDAPEVEAKHEIDVRGVRVVEVDGLVWSAIDAAIRADFGSLRIIHGKGTGALRERVSQLLEGDRRVRSFRLGAWNEGGAGVTVVEFS